MKRIEQSAPRFCIFLLMLAWMFQGCGGPIAPSYSNNSSISGDPSVLSAATQTAEDKIDPNLRSLCGIIATTAPQFAAPSEDAPSSEKVQPTRTPHVLTLKLSRSESCPVQQTIVLRVDGADKKKRHSRIWSILDKVNFRTEEPEAGEDTRKVVISQNSVTLIGLGFLNQIDTRSDDNLRLFFRIHDDQNALNESRLQVCGHGRCLKETRCGPEGSTRGSPIGMHSDEDKVFSCYLTPRSSQQL